MRIRSVTGRLGAALVLTIPALGTGAVQAARPAAGAGNTLTVAYSVQLTTLDPAQAVNPPDIYISAGALFSGLYRIDVNGKLVADIADGMPAVNKSQTVFTVKLKHGVVFNGVGFTPREVTSADVVYSMQRMMNPKLKPAASWGSFSDFGIKGAFAYNSGKAKSIAGIAALDRYTVQFTTEGPLSSFPYDLAISANYLVPREVVARYGADFGAHPIGTGPFMLKRWTRGQGAELVRNPRYFVRGLPYLDGISYQFNVGKQLEVLRWKSGQIDAIGDARDLAPNTIADLAGDPATAGYIEGDTPTPETNVLYVNHLIKPFDTLKARQALAYAINRKRLVKLYRGQALPSAQIYPPAVAQHDPGFRGYPYDPTRAAALLKESGYDGRPVELLVDTGSSVDPLVAPSLIQDLRAAGFVVRERDVSDQLAGQLQFQNRGYTLLIGYWDMDFPDAYNFVEATYTTDGVDGGLNFSRYKNPAIDALLARAERFPFGARRDAVYAAIQRTLVDEVASVPLFFRKRLNLNGPHVASLGWSPAYSLNEWAYARRK